MRFEWDPRKDDWVRTKYKRSDFGELVRGKYAKRIQKSTNVIVLDPQVAKVFPNDEAVNNALRGLIKVTRSEGRPGTKSKRTLNDKRRAA
jgi:hypothetical protein